MVEYPTVDVLNPGLPVDSVGDDSDLLSQKAGRRAALRLNGEGDQPHRHLLTRRHHHILLALTGVRRDGADSLDVSD